MASASDRAFYAILVVVTLFTLSCGHGGDTAPGLFGKQSFYVDSAAGNDLNAGTSPDRPWQTLAKISSAVMKSGSRVYLKRGSTWNEELILSHSGISVDAYGTGALPVIDGSRPVASWSDAGGGLYSSGSISLATGEALGNLSENGVMLSFVAWNGDGVTTFAGAVPGSYSYDFSSSTLYLYPSSLPSGNTYRASVKLFGIRAESMRDIIIRNVRITRFSLHGVELKDCVRCGVYSSEIGQGGGATIAPGLYAGNGIEFGNDSSYGIVDGVSISEIFDSGISPQTYLSSRTLSHLSIRNSSVSLCGFAGIELSVLSNGGSTGSSLSDVVVSGVTVSGSGKGWSGKRYGTEGEGVRIVADNGAGTMSGISLETTTVDGSAGDGVELGGEIGTVRLARMNITRNGTGIRLAEPSATSTRLLVTSSIVHHNDGYGVIYDSPTAAGLVSYQNTFADNGGINLAILNPSGPMEIMNNIFYGSSAMTDLYSQYTLTGAVIEHNCYNDLANMFGYGPNAYSSVSEFRSATGFESHGIGGDVGLASPAGGDLHLLATSQCTTLGSADVGVPFDYSGYPFSVPPSSGAYQYR